MSSNASAHDATHPSQGGLGHAGRDEHDAGHAHHVSPLSMYFAVFAALMVLLVVTVLLAFVDLGFMNIAVCYAVALTKGTLIIMYFMHVKQQTRLVWLFAGASFLWVAIMFIFSLGDYNARHPDFNRAEAVTRVERAKAGDARRPSPAQPSDPAAKPAAH